MSKINISSYPPLFRPTRQPASTESEPSDQPDDYRDPLPVIDMARLDGEKLGEACREWGIFRVVNHGVPEELITQLYTSARSLFDLSFESKQALIGAGGSGGSKNPAYSWGTPALTPAGVALARGAPNVDWLEVLSFALGRRGHSRDGSTTCEKEEEGSITDFRSLLDEYGQHMTKVAKRLFEEVARNLKLDQQQRLDGNKYLDESTGVLRVYRYLPNLMNNIDQEVKGMGVHTDSSVLTILTQDDVSGLQFLKDDLWIPIKPIPNTLVVNIGDMLQALSDDEYKSVVHQVMLNKQRERISIGYFVFPEDNIVISGSKGKYKPFTYKDFRTKVQLDLANVGWKVGLSHFRT